MNWQEFIQKESGKHGLSPELEATLLAALPEEKVQQILGNIALDLQISEAAVKSRLTEIYERFQESCHQLSQQKGAGKLKRLHRHLRQQYNQPEKIVRVNNSPIPLEFQSLIEEKIRTFCGRKFVFNAFVQFLDKHPKGYFTVLGDAGMGKSAIAAKYVHEHKAICYFNVLVDGRNRPELFLKSIRQQVINRYNLQNVDDADLSTLVTAVSQELNTGERLIIVVDALDEVEQEAGAENILYLPKTLPDKVYFFLTRRRYEPGKKRLFTEGVVQKELDLTAREYDRENSEDIQDYIRFCLDQDPENQAGLNRWIQTQNITPSAFIEQVAAKSENNFMYLRYVLPAIARGFYNDLSLRQLPDGLPDYYQTHWMRMKMDPASEKMRVIILFILIEIGTPIPCVMIADIANQEEFTVQEILNEWIEYLKPQPIDGDTCYSIYHASFLDFLTAKRELQPTRTLLKDVNQRIVDYWQREQEEDGQDC